MDADRAQRILKAIMVVSFAIALVALVGELRGWWNEIGEISITVATTVGSLAGIGTLLVGATSDEVRSVGDDVRSVGDDVRSVGYAVETVRSAVDANGAKLDGIETALVEEREDGHVSKLDIVQTELDHQTGALDRQVSLLAEIRDRM